MTQPNFILILIDDLGWRDLRCYGSTFYQTPNLDRLCAEGLRFTDAYAACPVCSPTRASILTGRYPARVGVTDWIGGHSRGKLLEVPYIDHLPLTEKSLARTLREAGYATWHVGKWHLGEDVSLVARHGFDVNVGGCGWGLPKNGYFSPWGIPTLDDGPRGEYLTDRLTDEAIRLIRQNDGRPFFLNLWYYAVHTPIQAKADKVAKYEAIARDLGLHEAETFRQGEYFPCEHKRDQRVMRRLLQSDATYAAMVESLDENIGRLLQALDEEGLTQDTAILFTSDNGGLATSEGSPTCNAPLAEGKGWMYEGGTREPLIVRWPGVTAPGSVCQTPVTSTDFYPTMLEMAGLDLLPEQHCDGVSLAPLFRGEGDLAREAIYWHYPHYGNQGGTPGSSMRCGQYKLIEFYEDRHRELYHLGADISEEHDLSGDEPGLTRDLGDALAAWRDEVGALVPQPNPAYTP
jgi:arylsulfatase A-like enzyme